MTKFGRSFTIGDWCWFTRQASPCRVIERQDVWGEVAYRVWLPAKDVVGRAQLRRLIAEFRGNFGRYSKTFWKKRAKERGQSAPNPYKYWLPEQGSNLRPAD